MAAIISAPTAENQIPSTPQNLGRMRTAAVWKQRVRRKDITAEIKPLFKAVKKPELKIPIPAKRKANEKRKNP